MEGPFRTEAEARKAVDLPLGYSYGWNDARTFVEVFGPKEQTL